MLTLYKPKYGELWFRRRLLADAETMAYNHAWGGTVDFPDENWRDWYDCWIGAHDGGRFYRYLKDGVGRFVGEIAYRFDAGLQGYTANVIVHSQYRGKGYGSLALALLCAAAKEKGIDALYDDIAADNPAVALFLRHGFTEEYRTGEKIILKKIL